MSGSLSLEFLLMTVITIIIIIIINVMYVTLSYTKYKVLYLKMAGVNSVTKNKTKGYM